MFSKKKHGFFCRCELCKLKRRQSILYIGCLIAFVIVILYQAFLTIIVTTKLNAVLLFIELMIFTIGIVRMLF